MFFTQFINNNNNNKNCQTHGFNPTQPDPTHVGWVGLGWTYVMGWVGLNFFLPTMVGWVKKSFQPDKTRPMHTPTCTCIKSSNEYCVLCMKNIARLHKCLHVMTI